MFIYMSRAVIQKKKNQSHPVNTVGFYSSQIMDMSTCNTCGKSVKDRKSIKCNLSDKSTSKMQLSKLCWFPIHEVFK